MDITHLIFLVVYLAMGFGHIPGFKVDRTGAALIALDILWREAKVLCWSAAAPGPELEQTRSEVVRKSWPTPALGLE